MSEGGAMFCDDRDRSYGCLFCRTGREETTANELKRLFPEIEIIVPVKSRYWRHGGVAREEHVVLFPGYIFFQVDNTFDVFVFAKCNNVYSLLKAPSGDWRIRNEDRKIVEKLFASKGVIGFSKAYFEGNRIRITEGFLKEYEGQIVRVNRRAQTAQIRIHIHEKEVLCWLGFEEIERT